MFQFQEHMSCEILIDADDGTLLVQLMWRERKRRGLLHANRIRIKIKRNDVVEIVLQWCYMPGGQM